MELTGGCLCGAVRFRAPARPQLLRHCHCVLCRKTSGSAFMSGLMYRSADVEWTGEMASYESSPGMLRLFCGKCGSPLAQREVAAPEKDCLTLGCFDDPSQIQIGNVDHVFAERQLAWLPIDDGYPHHVGIPSGLFKVE